MYPTKPWPFLLLFIASFCRQHCQVWTHSIKRPENDATVNPNLAWNLGTGPERELWFQTSPSRLCTHETCRKWRRDAHRPTAWGSLEILHNYAHTVLPVMVPALLSPCIPSPRPTRYCSHLQRQGGQKRQATSSLALNSNRKLQDQLHSLCAWGGAEGDLQDVVVARQAWWLEH